MSLDRSAPDAWKCLRHELREAFRSGIEPAGFGLSSGVQPALFEPVSSPSSRREPRFPRVWRPIFRRVAHHREAEVVSLLYRLLWRYADDASLPQRSFDPDVRRLAELDAAVRRDAHKTKAFVRFRKVGEGKARRFVAWHRPDHYVLPLVARFFAERFSDMAWSILTPSRSLHFNGKEISWSEGASRRPSDAADDMEELWRTYYRATFNPARVNLKAMKAEMPMKHWSTLPETADLESLLREAPARVAAMAAEAEARPDVEKVMPPPGRRSLPALRLAAPACRACDVADAATQVVFGEGPFDARVVVVGEQPGDQEDLEGRPFVGPAGRVLRSELAAVGLSDVYVTNAVKHFRFRGKKRIHARPRAGEIQRCRPWLLAELEALKPEVLIVLGATAARSLLGHRLRFSELVGKEVSSPFAAHTLVGWHPAAILRAEVTTAAEMKDELRSTLRRALRHVDDALAGRALPLPPPGS